jgi:hypothetical protein
MAKSDWHLAQLNVGRVVAPTDSPVLADFMNALDRINALAEASPGLSCGSRATAATPPRS